MTDPKSQTHSSLLDKTVFKDDRHLPAITEAEYKQRSQEVIRYSRMGHQIAIKSEDGKIRSIVGLNGVRVLPKTPVDPNIQSLIDGGESPDSNQADPWVK